MVNRDHRAQTATVEPIDHVDLSEKVYRLLREKIFAREFEPGSKLDMYQLAEGFRISRGPVNTAIIRLAEEGLVTVEPRRGTFITELTATDLSETFQVRPALEALGAELTVPRLQEGALDGVRFGLDRLSALRFSIKQDYLEYVRLDRDFHRGLLALTGNQKLVAMFEGLHTDMINARLYYYGPLRDREQVDEEHRALLAAYEARDVDAARRLLYLACERSCEAAVRRIGELGGVI